MKIDAPMKTPKVFSLKAETFIMRNKGCLIRILLTAVNVEFADTMFCDFCYTAI